MEHGLGSSSRLDGLVLLVVKLLYGSEEVKGFLWWGVTPAVMVGCS
jgi:hypothetical protein